MECSASEPGALTDLNVVSYCNSENNIDNSIACGFPHGIILYSIDPIATKGQIQIYNSGVSIAQYLTSEHLVAFVGNGEHSAQFAKDTLVLWDYDTNVLKTKLQFDSDVLNVAISADFLIVVLNEFIGVYQLKSLNLMYTFKTIENPRGLCTLNKHSGMTLLVAPHTNKGDVQLIQVDDKPSVTVFTAHQLEFLSSLAFTPDNLILVTCCERELLIKLFAITESPAKATYIRTIDLESPSDDAYLRISALTFNYNGTYLAATLTNGLIFICSMNVKDKNNPSVNGTTTPEVNCMANINEILGAVLFGWFKPVEETKPVESEPVSEKANYVIATIKGLKPNLLVVFNRTEENKLSVISTATSYVYQYTFHKGGRCFKTNMTKIENTLIAPVALVHNDSFRQSPMQFITGDSLSFSPVRSQTNICDNSMSSLNFSFDSDIIPSKDDRDVGLLLEQSEIDGKMPRGREVQSQADRSAEQARIADLARIEAEQLAEETRVAELARLEEERLKEEARVAELARIETERLAEEARLAELARLEAERLAKEARIAELARIEAERMAEEAKVAELARLEAERLKEEARIAELARIEAERLAEEARVAELARIEIERLAEEARIAELARLEAERLKEEARIAELARIEAERLAEEARIAELARIEAERLAEEDRVAELARIEAERLAEEDRLFELARLEAERLKEEARIAELARIEAERLAEEARVAELARMEIERLAEEDRLFELARLEAERVKEEARIAELARIESERLAEEARVAELARIEAERLAEEARVAELARIEAERLAEEARIAELARIEAERLVGEARVAELARIEAERLAEEDRLFELARLEAERVKEEARIAELARIEAERLAEEARVAELARIEAERLAEEARIVELVRIEAERLAEETRIAELARIEAERLAEEARVAEQARIEAERLVGEARVAELARIEAERLAEEDRLFELARLEAERVKEEARIAELARIEAERLAEEARVAELARVEAERLAEEARIVELARIEAERLAEEARIAELARIEAERLAEEARVAESKRVAEDKAAARIAAAKAKLAEENRLVTEQARLEAEAQAEASRLAQQTLKIKKAETFHLEPSYGKLQPQPISNSGNNLIAGYEPIVIDNGSGLCKCGFAGNDMPSVVFPSMIGTPKYQEVNSSQSLQDMYVGSDAESRRGVLALRFPVERGIVTNWEDMEAIWNHAYSNELRVNPEDHPVLLTEAPLNPTKNREQMLSIMFETFQVPAMYIKIQAVLSLLSTGRTTGLAVDSGDGVTSTVPIYEGYSVENAIQRINLAGSDITSYLMKILQEKGTKFSTSSEREVVRDIKEKHSYIALEYDNEMSHSSKTNQNERVYELPDGHEIILSDERFRAPEILFQPSLIGMELPGIHECIHKSIFNCEIDLRKELYSNIILSGGTTMIQNLDERLTNELVCLAPKHINVKVISPPERRFSVWIGGSMLASLDSFEDMWITKMDYAEYGTNIVHTKCY